MVNETPSIHPNISCSWAPDVCGTILTFGDKDDTNQWDVDGAVIHAIAEDNFMYLNNLKEDLPCMITIKTNDNFSQITNISLVSEARIFEIYGKHGEYINTCRCEYLTNEKGIEFNVGQTSLLTTHEISIKFPGLRKGFWLCGIKLIINKISTPISTFDHHLINEKLQSSNVQISEKAESFKKFLQDYGANKYPPQTIDPQLLLKFMERECIEQLKPLSTTSKSISEYLSALIPSSLKNQNVNKQSEENVRSDTCSGTEESSFSSLKTYVDESLGKLEDKLQQNFKKQLEELEAKQNEKLDTILELLQNSALR